MTINRRHFHKRSGAILLTYLIGSRSVFLSPAEAREKNLPYQAISQKAGQLIDLLGEAIVPGSARSGLSHYIDHQLTASKTNSLLIIKYLGIQCSYQEFYRLSLNAFERSYPLFQKRNINHISSQAIKKYIAVMAQKNPPVWSKSGEVIPPAPLFYFTLRSDAVDVTYGTMAGFDKLEIPYMAHIEPEGTGWS